MADPLDSVRGGYDRWAAVYDHDGNPLQGLEEPVVRRGGRRRPRARRPRPGLRHRPARPLAGHAGATVTAVDFSEGMLAEARRKPGAERGPLPRPRPAPAAAFREPSSTWSSAGSCWSTSARPAASSPRPAGCSRPGGRAVVSAMHPAMFLRGTPGPVHRPASPAEVVAGQRAPFGRGFVDGRGAGGPHGRPRRTSTRPTPRSPPLPPGGQVRRLADARRATVGHVTGSRGPAMRVLSGHVKEVRGVAFLADGRLVSVGADKTARLWDVTGGTGTVLTRARARCTPWTSRRTAGRSPSPAGTRRRVLPSPSTTRPPGGRPAPSLGRSRTRSGTGPGSTCTRSASRYRGPSGHWRSRPTGGCSRPPAASPWRRTSRTAAAGASGRWGQGRRHRAAGRGRLRRPVRPGRRGAGRHRQPAGAVLRAGRRVRAVHVPGPVRVGRPWRSSRPTAGA